MIAVRYLYFFQELKSIHMYKIRLFLLAGMALMGSTALAGNPPAPGKTQLTVAFYNLENLFDTQDDPAINDADFLPTGANQWDEAKLRIKMDNMARVISQLGDEDGPELLGVCEVENRGVLETLVANKALKKRGYEIVHIDSHDERGIDCALLYKKKRFLPLYSQAFAVALPDPKDRTRDVLLVKGIVDGKHDLTVMVNHWPSRRGGPEKSATARDAAAATVRHLVDSIQALDPQASILIMGDLNDGPTDHSLHEVLKAGKDSTEAMTTLLYNPMYKMEADGYGTLKYKSEWDLFDQIIMSAPLLSHKAPLRYSPCSANVYNPSWMRVPDGEYVDGPKRTYIGKNFKSDGFSDHFPVYLQIEY
jgi:predicted extracellular nuclease